MRQIKRIFRNEELIKGKNANNVKAIKFNVGDYVLIDYPNRPPHKLSAIYRGPMKILGKIRDDIFECYDLVSNKSVRFHIDRLRTFNVGKDITEEKMVQLAAKDKDEYIVEQIVEYRGNPKGKRSLLEFRVRWQGYDDTEDTWLPYRNVRDLIALDTFIVEHPELNI